MVHAAGVQSLPMDHYLQRGVEKEKYHANMMEVRGRPWQIMLFPWQSVVEITTTVTNRYDELDEVVCELLPDKQTVV